MTSIDTRTRERASKLGPIGLILLGGSVLLGCGSSSSSAELADSTSAPSSGASVGLDADGAGTTTSGIDDSTNDEAAEASAANSAMPEESTTDGADQAEGEPSGATVSEDAASGGTANEVMDSEQVGNVAGMSSETPTVAAVDSGGGGASSMADDAPLVAPGSAGADTSTVELEPAPGDYGDRAELLEPNSEMAVAELDGKIYVVGGYPASRVVQTSVQVYDIASDSWDMAAPYPVPVHHPVVAAYAGKLYSFGGQDDTDRVFAFDPSQNQWQELQPMPTARGAGASAVLDGKVYVVGGRPTAANNEFEVYDVAEDSWEELADLPPEYPERNHLAAAAIGGKIYVAGGRYNGGGFGDPRTDSLDIFDPATGMWSQGAPMLRERGGLNGIAANGCFFVWGGEGQGIGEPNDVYPDHDVYNPVTDEWTSLPDLPTPVHGVTGAAFVDGLIYMPGGGDQSGGSSGTLIHQVYRVDRNCD